MLPCGAQREVHLQLVPAEPAARCGSADLPPLATPYLCCLASITMRHLADFLQGMLSVHPQQRLELLLPESARGGGLASWRPGVHGPHPAVKEGARIEPLSPSTTVAHLLEDSPARPPGGILVRSTNDLA
eukprot:jgi/Mesen1/1635/ME000135S00628